MESWNLIGYTIVTLSAWEEQLISSNFIWRRYESEPVIHQIQKYSETMKYVIHLD
jgi:hypothetical protein